jgi:hypothetical protein
MNMRTGGGRRRKDEGTGQEQRGRKEERRGEGLRTRGSNNKGQRRIGQQRPKGFFVKKKPTWKSDYGQGAGNP